MQVPPKAQVTVGVPPPPELPPDPVLAAAAVTVGVGVGAGVGYLTELGSTPMFVTFASVVILVSLTPSDNK